MGRGSARLLPMRVLLGWDSEMLARTKRCAGCEAFLPGSPFSSLQLCFSFLRGLWAVPYAKSLQAKLWGEEKGKCYLCGVRV